MEKKIQDDDTFLIQKCKQGDKNAFDSLMLKYQDRVFNIIFRLVGDKDLASDLVQETFINAYKGLKNFKEQSAFFTWLFRIATNATRNNNRKNAKNKIVSISKYESSESNNNWLESISKEKEPSENIEKEENNILVQNAILSLEEPYRTAIVLRDIDGLSYEEMQEILHCPIGTVRSRIHRARNLLKEKLEILIDLLEA